MPLSSVDQSSIVATVLELDVTESQSICAVNLCDLEMAVVVFEESLSRRYMAPMCSLAFCFHVLVVVGIVVVPFYVAFASENFWLKTNTYFEQPRVRFKYDVLFILQGTAGEGKGLSTWAWSTNQRVREAYEPYLRAPIIRAWSSDDNLDDLADRWSLTIQIPLEEQEKVHQVQAIAVFDYSLIGRGRLDMDGLAYIEYASPIPGSSLSVDAEAKLRQKRPLSVRRPNSNPELRFAEGSNSIQPNKIGVILSSYAKRNFTMELANQYKAWGASAGLDTFSTTAGSFCVNFTLRVPVDEIVYTPDVSEVLKVAWIQYLSIFALFFVLFYFLKQFVFTNQVLETMVDVDRLVPFSKVKQHRF